MKSTHGSLPRYLCTLQAKPFGDSQNVSRHVCFTDVVAIYKWYFIIALCIYPNFVLTTCRTQNSNILRAGRGEAAHGGAPGRSRAGQRGTPTGRFAEETPSFPPRHRRSLSWTSLRKHEQRKSYVNRIEEHSDRLTTEIASALRSWQLTSRPTPDSLCNMSNK